MPKRSIEQLRDELRKIDDDLARLSEQEREAERGIDAWRFRPAVVTEKQKGKLSEHENPAPLH